MDTYGSPMMLGRHLPEVPANSAVYPTRATHSEQLIQYFKLLVSRPVPNNTAR